MSLNFLYKDIFNTKNMKKKKEKRVFNQVKRHQNSSWRPIILSETSRVKSKEGIFTIGKENNVKEHETKIEIFQKLIIWLIFIIYSMWRLYDCQKIKNNGIIYLMINWSRWQCSGFTTPKWMFKTGYSDIQSVELWLFYSWLFVALWIVFYFVF